MRWLRQRPTYLRIFIAVSFVFLLLTSTISIGITTLFSKYVYEEVDKFSADKLQQTMENTEFVLRNLKDDGLRLYEDAAIKNWLYSHEEQALSQNEAKNTLSKFIVTEPYIKRVLLINTQTNRVFDSNYGLERMQDSRNRLLLEHIQQNTVPQLQFYSYTSNDSGLQEIALLIPGQRTNGSGYVVILLDQDMFRRFLLRQNSDIGVKVFIVDEQNRIILGDSSQTDEWVPDRVANIEDKIKGHYRIGLSSGNWSVNYSQMNSQSWTIHYMAQMKDWERKVDGIQKVTILVFLGFALVLTLFLYWSLHRNVRPFSLIAAKLHIRSGMLPIEKEVDFIANSIESLENNLNDLDYSLRSQQEMVKEQLLRQWLHGGNLNKTLFENFKSEYIRVIVLRLEAYELFKKEYSYESRKLFKYGIRNIASELFWKNQISVQSVDMDGDHVVLLVAETKAGFDGMVEVTMNSLREISTWLKISCVASISERVKSSQDIGIRKVYERTYEANRLKFIYGDQRIYTEVDYERYLGTTQPADIDTRLERLLLMVKQGDWDKRDSYLQELINSISKLAYQDIEIQLALIFYRLNSEFDLFGDSEVFSISPFLKQFSTLQEVKEWLSNRLSEVMDTFSEEDARASASRRDEIVGNVTDFIQSQLHDPTLNVEQIADFTSYSSRYIRQLFKESMHTTVTDYILKERLKRVKLLLIESGYTVADIAGQTGFLTKSHFFTAFKKETSLTPVEFRKLYQQSMASK